MKQKYEGGGKVIVCAGTGFTGDCEANKPQCPVKGTPEVYKPGWCTAPPLPPPSNCSTCAFEEDVHYPCGSSCDLGHGDAATKESCCASCGQTQGCAKFVWSPGTAHTRGKYCMLKSAPFGEPKASKGLTSGGCANVV